MQRAYFLLGLGLSFGLVLSGLFAPKAEAQFQRGGDVSIILYSDTGFRGEARAYYGDVESLSRDGFNDLARSVEIRGGAWTLCRDRGGRGRCQTIEHSIADLGQLGLDCELTSFYQSGFSDAGFRRDRGGRHDRRRNDRRRGGFGHGDASSPMTILKAVRSAFMGQQTCAMSVLTTRRTRLSFNRERGLSAPNAILKANAMSSASQFMTLMILTSTTTYPP